MALGTDISVSTTAELDAAIGCYNASDAGTAYTITLAADIDYGAVRGAIEITQAGTGSSLKRCAI